MQAFSPPLYQTLPVAAVVVVAGFLAAVVAFVVVDATAPNAFVALLNSHLSHCFYCFFLETSSWGESVADFSPLLTTSFQSPRPMDAFPDLMPLLLLLVVLAWVVILDSSRGMPSTHHRGCLGMIFSPLSPEEQSSRWQCLPCSL